MAKLVLLRQTNASVNNFLKDSLLLGSISFLNDRKNWRKAKYNFCELCNKYVYLYNTCLMPEAEFYKEQIKTRQNEKVTSYPMHVIVAYHAKLFLGASWTWRLPSR
jgi:hypothetical protein